MERYDLIWIPPLSLSDDRPFGTRRRYDDEGLRSSIARFGVVVPLLGFSSGGEIKIISGSRRLEAARAAGLDRVPVLLLKETLEDKDAFRLALVSNWRESRTELDAAAAFRRAVELGFTSEEILMDLLPLLGLPSERHWIQELESLSGLCADLQDDLEAGRLPVRGAAALARLDAAAQAAFSRRLARCLRLTSSQLMKTLEWLLDLTRSEGIPLERLLDRPGLKDILEEKTEDARQKTDRFFRRLRELRFPRQTAQEKEFEAAAKAVEKGASGLVIEAPPFFEEPGFQVRLKVRDEQALERLLDAVAEKRSSMRELFKIVL